MATSAASSARPSSPVRDLTLAQPPVGGLTPAQQRFNTDYTQVQELLSWENQTLNEIPNNPAGADPALLDRVREASRQAQASLTDLMNRVSGLEIDDGQQAAFTKDITDFQEEALGYAQQIEGFGRQVAGREASAAPLRARAVDVTRSPSPTATTATSTAAPADQSQPRSPTGALIAQIRNLQAEHEAYLTGVQARRADLDAHLRHLPVQREANQHQLHQLHQAIQADLEALSVETRMTSNDILAQHPQAALQRLAAASSSSSVTSGLACTVAMPAAAASAAPAVDESPLRAAQQEVFAAAAELRQLANQNSEALNEHNAALAERERDLAALEARLEALPEEHVRAEEDLRRPVLGSLEARSRAVAAALAEITHRPHNNASKSNTYLAMPRGLSTHAEIIERLRGEVERRLRKSIEGLAERESLNAVTMARLVEARDNCERAWGNDSRAREREHARGQLLEGQIKLLTDLIDNNPDRMARKREQRDDCTLQLGRLRESLRRNEDSYTSNRTRANANLNRAAAEGQESLERFNNRIAHWQQVRDRLNGLLQETHDISRERAAQPAASSAAPAADAQERLAALAAEHLREAQDLTARIASTTRDLQARREHPPQAPSQLVAAQARCVRANDAARALHPAIGGTAEQDAAIARQADDRIQLLTAQHRDLTDALPRVDDEQAQPLLARTLAADAQVQQLTDRFQDRNSELHQELQENVLALQDDTQRYEDAEATIHGSLEDLDRELAERHHIFNTRMSALESQIGNLNALAQADSEAAGLHAARRSEAHAAAAAIVAGLVANAASQNAAPATVTASNVTTSAVVTVSASMDAILAALTARMPLGSASDDEDLPPLIDPASSRNDDNGASATSSTAVASNAAATAALAALTARMPLGSASDDEDLPPLIHPASSRDDDNGASVTSSTAVASNVTTSAAPTATAPTPVTATASITAALAALTAARQNGSTASAVAAADAVHSAVSSLGAATAGTSSSSSAVSTSTAPVTATTSTVSTPAAPTAAVTISSTEREALLDAYEAARNNVDEDPAPAEAFASISYLIECEALFASPVVSNKWLAALRSIDLLVRGASDMSAAERNGDIHQILGRLRESGVPDMDGHLSDIYRDVRAMSGMDGSSSARWNGRYCSTRLGEHLAQVERVVQRKYEDALAMERSAASASSSDVARRDVRAPAALAPSSPTRRAPNPYRTVLEGLRAFRGINDIRERSRGLVEFLETSLSDAQNGALYTHVARIAGQPDLNRTREFALNHLGEFLGTVQGYIRAQLMPAVIVAAPTAATASISA